MDEQILSRRKEEPTCHPSPPCLDPDCENCEPFRLFKGLIVAMAISGIFYLGMFGIWWAIRG